MYEATQRKVVPAVVPPAERHVCVRESCCELALLSYYAVGKTAVPDMSKRRRRRRWADYEWEEDEETNQCCKYPSRIAVMGAGPAALHRVVRARYASIHRCGLPRTCLSVDGRHAVSGCASGYDIDPAAHVARFAKSRLTSSRVNGNAPAVGSYTHQLDGLQPIALSPLMPQNSAEHILCPGTRCCRDGKSEVGAKSVGVVDVDDKKSNCLAVLVSESSGHRKYRKSAPRAAVWGLPYAVNPSANGRTLLVEDSTNQCYCACSRIFPEAPCNGEGCIQWSTKPLKEFEGSTVIYFRGTDRGRKQFIRSTTATVHGLAELAALTSGAIVNSSRIFVQIRGPHFNAKHRFYATGWPGNLYRTLE
ncbi:hypothetical protein B0H11DRAFT_1926682 [Mycena galericulata]|nr:hypothetical protein B0H11DRAFT_1926682 [Mycena galericulata]